MSDNTIYQYDGDNYEDLMLLQNKLSKDLKNAGAIKRESNDVYFINGVLVNIFLSYFNGNICFYILGDDELAINGNINCGPVLTVQALFDRMPNMEDYNIMRKKHEHERNINNYSTIENAIEQHKILLKPLKKALKILNVKFIDGDALRFYINEIPVEVVPRTPCSDDDFKCLKYICYVIDKFGNRTNMFYNGDLIQIVNSLPTIDEYNALYGAECKSAALKK